MNYIECLFIKDGLKHPVASPLTDVNYFDHDGARQHVAKRIEQGIHHFLIFGIPLTKSIRYGADPHSAVAKLLTALKQTHGAAITLYADVGLSPYREDGHSVVISEHGIDRRQSYEDAIQLALAFARAGADYLAPCLSLEDQVAELGNALEAAQLNAKLMPYSAKFSSALYGPFRTAIASTLGEQRKPYQTDFQQPEKALNQLSLDQQQGAAIAMVKPGIFYLDILLRAKDYTTLPLAVFHVSGEYMMIKRAAEYDGLNEADAFDEVHSAFARCGASYIIGYAAEHFLRGQ